MHVLLLRFVPSADSVFVLLENLEQAFNSSWSDSEHFATHDFAILVEALLDEELLHLGFLKIDREGDSRLVIYICVRHWIESLWRMVSVHIFC